MFTSHEMNGDYVSFFKSLKELAVMLNIACDPRYIVIDASRAMVYAIKKIFPLCIIIMCWFHLKYNV